MAVDGVDLTIGSGEAVGLVGESGSGKTVLALSILGLLPEGSGSILPGSSVRLRGEELVGADERRLREVRGGEIAMVFQEPMTSLNPVLTIGDQIGEVLQIHRSLSVSEVREETVRFLADVGIPDPAERVRAYPHQLSGGMRQRATIAMAVAGQPALLVADEPTTALDPTLQSQILDLLQDLRQRFGMALLLVSHDLVAVSRICQRVVVLYGGRVMEAGPVPEVLGNPAHPYTRALLAARPTWEGRGTMVPIPGEVPEATRWPSGCRFHPRCPEAMDRCRSEEPEMVTQSATEPSEPGLAAAEGEERIVRCWLSQDGESAGK
jgi:oligopeptide/dipeptide ABC transporter ATP-binding protein